MKSTELQRDEFSGHYIDYIEQVPGEFTLMDELKTSLLPFMKFVQNIPSEKYDYCYAEGKWTLKDTIQHLIDAERIFAYRALHFARNHEADLRRLDANDYSSYANAAKADERSIPDLLLELAIVRQGTISLFHSFSEQALLRKGTISDRLISVRALGFVIVGHQNHHQRIFQQRYLSNPIEN